MNFLEKWMVEKLLTQSDAEIDSYREGRLIDEFQTPDGAWQYTINFDGNYQRVICGAQIPSDESNHFWLYSFHNELLLNTVVMLAARRDSKTHQDLTHDAQLVLNSAEVAQLFLPSRKRKNV